MPDILRITTPLVNKSTEVRAGTGPEAASAFNIQTARPIVAPQRQGDATGQNAGVLQEKDTPTLLLSLLKDPAVAVTYLQNIGLLEETFQLLPSANATMTEEIEQIFNTLMLGAEEIAPELERQQALSTSFRGEFFDFLRELSEQNAGNARLQTAVAAQLKAAGALMNRRDVLDAVANNLTYLRGGAMPGSALETRIDALIAAFRRDDAPENFAALKGSALEILKELEGSLLQTPQMGKNLSIAMYNLSRYNGSETLYREAMLFLRKAMPPSQRNQFVRLAQAFYAESAGSFRAQTAESSRVMTALTQLIYKQAQADHDSASEEAKTEKILHSLLSSPCNFTPLLHFVVPALAGGAQAFAELWINPRSDEKDMPEGEGKGIHILLVADVEGAGRFEAEFFVHGQTLDFSLFCPTGQERNYEAVMAQLPALLKDTEYKMGKTRLEPLETARSLMEVFKSLPYKRMGVDVKI